MASKRKLKFLVDKCVEESVSSYIKEQRHISLLSFDEAGLNGRSQDPTVIEKATQNGAMLVTSDKRFTESHIPLCSHEGIIKFNTKFIIRLECFRKFLHMRERHDAWKSITHLYEDRIVMRQHTGSRLVIPYP